MNNDKTNKLKKKIRYIFYVDLSLILLLSGILVYRFYDTSQKANEINVLIESLVNDPGPSSDISTTPTIETEETDKNAFYKGFRIAGYVDIPSVSIQLPILDTLEALDTSVIRYVGSLNVVGNTVIAGHRTMDWINFFGPIVDTNIGDLVHLTRYKGSTVTYEIIEKKIVDDTDVSILDQNNDGIRKLTMFTCLKDQPTKRVVVIAIEKV